MPVENITPANFVQVKASLVRDLALSVASAEFAASKLCLFVNDIIPIESTLIGDLTEATYGTYAEKTITNWGATFVDADSKATSLSPLQTFTTDGTAPQSVYGFYIKNAAGDLVLAGRFADAPRPMAAPTDVIAMVIAVQLGQQG